jgi:hypothetical protein
MQSMGCSSPYVLTHCVQFLIRKYKPAVAATVLCIFLALFFTQVESPCQPASLCAIGTRQQIVCLRVVRHTGRAPRYPPRKHEPVPHLGNQSQLQRLPTGARVRGHKSGGICCLLGDSRLAVWHGMLLNLHQWLDLAGPTRSPILPRVLIFQVQSVLYIDWLATRIAEPIPQVTCITIMIAPALMHLTPGTVGTLILPQVRLTAPASAHYSTAFDRAGNVVYMIRQLIL